MAILLFATPDVGFTTDGYVSAVTWHPDSKRLYIAAENHLLEWPGNRRVVFETAISDEPSSPVSRLEISNNGKQLIASDNYSHSFFLVDLKRFSSRTVPGDRYCVWWIGDTIASVRPYVHDGGWTNQQYVEIGTRRRPLPSQWRFSSADPGGTVLLAKGGGGLVGPIALFKLNPDTLTVRKFRTHSGIFAVEYVEQDSIDWNESIRTAVIGLTADTGATLSAPWFSRSSGLQPYQPLKHIFLHSVPQWVGDRALAVTREFRESNMNSIIYGADTYRIQLVNPRTRQVELLATQDNRWTANPNSPTQDSYRAGQPVLEHAAISADGKRLAWVVYHPRKEQSEIVIKKL